MQNVHDNPFTSPTFTTTWKKHFARHREFYTTSLFQGLNFVKHKWLPLYINCGQTLTKGISYRLNPGSKEELNNKVFLIFDSPLYFSNPGSAELHGEIARYSIRQYPGFLIELAGFNDLNGYMLANFSKSSRYKLNKYKKRLEQSFTIRYEMYIGNIEKSLYDSLFDAFKYMLKKRFADKQEYNNNLSEAEWSFYKEVAYPMILEKKAGLFVVYQDETPIAITLNYLSENILFDAITVFDTDYGKFHLGSVSIMGLITWCIDNHVENLDFSKGYFDYKKRWATRQYDFEYHIFYNSNSAISKLTARLLRKYFELKQALRERHWNEKLHQFTYRLRHPSARPGIQGSFEFQDTERIYEPRELCELNLAETDSFLVRSIVFDFLYLNEGTLQETRIYKLTEHENTYYLTCKDIHKTAIVNTSP